MSTLTPIEKLNKAEQYLEEDRRALIPAGLKLIRSALNDAPNDFEVQFNGARLLYEFSSRLEETADVLARCIKIRPDSVAALRLLGDTHLALNNFDEALAAFQSLLMHTKDDYAESQVHFIPNRKPVYVIGQLPAEIMTVDIKNHLLSQKISPIPLVYFYSWDATLSPNSGFFDRYRSYAQRKFVGEILSIAKSEGAKNALAFLEAQPESKDLFKDSFRALLLFTQKRYTEFSPDKLPDFLVMNPTEALGYLKSIFLNGRHHVYYGESFWRKRYLDRIAGKRRYPTIFRAT